MKETNEVLIKQLLVNAYIEIAMLKGNVDEFDYYNNPEYQENVLELTTNHINNILKSVKQDEKASV